MPDIELTPEERALVPPQRRVRAHPVFRVVCVLLVAAMIPLPWTQYTGCSGPVASRVVTNTGAHLLFQYPASGVLTVAALALALAAPLLAHKLDRDKRLTVDLLCLVGLLLFSAWTGLQMMVPLSQNVVLLAPGAVTLVTLLVITVDAGAALVQSARLPPRARAPDDTG